MSGHAYNQARTHAQTQYGLVMAVLAIADAIEARQLTRHTIVESVERERGSDLVVVTTKRPDGRVERFYCTHSEIDS